MIFVIRSQKKFVSSLSLALVFSFVISFVTLISAISTTTAHAQQAGGPVITIIPKHPGPFQNVTIKVDEFSRDPNSLNIAWTLDGKSAQSGTGLKEFKFTTGALGTVHNVSINVGGVSRAVTIRPAVVDLMWQADSFTPPFYSGKALHSNQDPVTVVAEPFFLNAQKVRINPSTLIYNWKQDGKAVGSASGYGKKTFKVTPSILMKPIEIEVEVSSSDGVYHATSRISVSDTKPEVTAYENHPLYGIIFQNALNGKDFVMSGSETRIAIMPYYFSNEQKKINALDYTWKLNNSLIPEKNDEIVFRKPENVRQGSSAVTLNVKNNTRFMQSSDASFNVKFSNEVNNTTQGVF
jgi:hypothetical protein